MPTFFYLLSPVSLSKRKPHAKPIKTTVKQRIAPLNNILSAVINFSPMDIVMMKIIIFVILS